MLGGLERVLLAPTLHSFRNVSCLSPLPPHSGILSHQLHGRRPLIHGLQSESRVANRHCQSLAWGLVQVLRRLRAQDSLSSADAQEVEYLPPLRVAPPRPRQIRASGLNFSGLHDLNPKLKTPNPEFALGASAGSAWQSCCA